MNRYGIPMTTVPSPARRPELPLGERMTALAETFPSLRGVPGVRPWDAATLERWAAGPAPSSGALLAAQLLLMAWNRAIDWQCGRFDLGRAVATWDASHRQAFAAYAADPWLA